MKRAMLVYQGAVANVFAVDVFNLRPEGRNARRLTQHAFEYCVAFARGLAAAGVTVRTAACNRAGDIVDQEWTYDLRTQPFAKELVRVGEVTLVTGRFG